MQNKGFVKVFAVLLTLVCVFYLSFLRNTPLYSTRRKKLRTATRKWNKTTSTLSPMKVKGN